MLASYVPSGTAGSNMTGPHIISTALSDSQQACVELLREALAEAERGAIFSVGVIACMDGGFATVMAGVQAGDLNLGCDDLKRKILDAVTGGNVARPKPKRSTILQVR